MFSCPFDQHRDYYLKNFKVGRQDEYIFENPAEAKLIAAKSANKQPLYPCQFCGTKYGCETGVEAHKAKAHHMLLMRRINSSKHVCRACMRKKKSKEKLINHIKFHHLFSSASCKRVEREIFICDYCHCLYFNKKMLIIHMNLHHGCLTDTKCPKCFKDIRRQRLYPHLELHAIKSISTCQFCFVKLETRYAMLEHIKDHHKSYLRCETCAYETDKTVVFETHLQTIHGQEVDFKASLDVTEDVVVRCFVPRSTEAKAQKYRPILTLKGLNLDGLVSICTLCREICTTDTEKREHIARVHTSKPNTVSKPTYQCDCGEKFFNKVLLKHHLFKLKDHKQVSDDKFKNSIDKENSLNMVVEYTDVSIQKCKEELNALLVLKVEENAEEINKDLTIKDESSPKDVEVSLEIENLDGNVEPTFEVVERLDEGDSVIISVAKKIMD